MGWFPEAYAEPASNSVKADEENSAASEAKESNQYVALFPYNSEGMKFEKLIILEQSKLKLLYQNSNSLLKMEC